MIDDLWVRYGYRREGLCVPRIGVCCFRCHGTATQHWDSPGHSGGFQPHRGLRQTPKVGDGAAVLSFETFSSILPASLRPTMNKNGDLFSRFQRSLQKHSNS